MTKVHRYLLRSDDDAGTLADEIKSAKSYLHLSMERFDAIETSINLDSAAMQKFIPPLSMQVILDSIYTNALIRSPLYIHIYPRRSELCENWWEKYSGRTSK